MCRHLDHRTLVLALEDILLPHLQSGKPDQIQNSSPMNKHRNYIYLELSNCGGSVIIVIEASKIEARWLVKGLKIFFLSSSSVAIGTRIIVVVSWPPVPKPIAFFN